MKTIRRRLPLAAYVVALTLGSLSASIAADPGPSRVVVENQRLALVLAAGDAKGAIVSLKDKATDREWIIANEAPRLFQLDFSKRGDPGAKSLALTNREAREVSLTQQTSQGRTEGRVVLSKLAGRPIDVVCAFVDASGDPLVRCRIEVRFPEDLVLEGVRFPLVMLRMPTGKDASDALVLGATKGGVHRRPSAWPPGRSVAYSQPGSLAAQFACYYDDAGGLFTAAEDARGYPKAIFAGRIGGGLLWCWYRPCFESSRDVQAYDVVFTTFRSPNAPAEPTDWRDAADIYKQWAVRQPWCAKTLARRDDLPAWLKAGPAMVRFGRDWLADPGRIESWLTGYWQKYFAAGVPLIVAYWGWEKVDTWITPDYFPAFPSDDAVRRLVQLGRKLGGHTFFWPSGYHYTLTYRKQPGGDFAWDDRTRFEATARPHSVCGRDGKPVIFSPFWLDGGQTATMCAGDPWTIDWLNRTATQIAERGVELVQIDQVVGGGIPVCYSTSHGHPPGSGTWMTDAVHRQLDAMLAACRKIEPEAVVCFEEPDEWFIHQVGVQDYRDWEVLQQDGVEPASVFNYLYHEYLPTFQSNPQAGDRLQAAYCLANGQIPHLVPSMLIGPGPLLANGGFEAWNGNVPAGWDKVSGWLLQTFAGLAFRDEKVRHGGRSSLRLENRAAGEIVQVSQNVPVGGPLAVGRKYRLSAWMKSAGLRQPNAIMLGTFALALANTGSWRIAMPQTAGDWARGEAIFTVPKGSQMLRIMLHLQGPGTVWIDDLALEEMRDDGTAVEIPRPDKPADHDFMRQWVELFHGAGRPYLLLGKMLHPGRLETGTIEVRGRRLPAIFHNGFAAPDGSEAVVVVNGTESPQTGRLHWKGKSVSLSLKPGECRLLRWDTTSQQ